MSPRLRIHGELLVCGALLAATLLAWLALVQVAFSAEVTLERGEIRITGTIEMPDWPKFINLAAPLIALSSPLVAPVVVLDSRGGWTGPARDIGNYVREHMLTTIVRDGKTCSSSCVLIWIAGIPRVLEPAARLGLHSTAFPEDLKKRNDAGNRAFGAYLRRMNAPQPFIDLQPRAEPWEVNYVDYRTAKSWGLIPQK